MSDKKALIIIDIQNDYFDGGKFPLVGTLEAAKNAKLLLEDFRKKNLDILHIQHIKEDPKANFFAVNTNGVEINDLVKPLASEKVIVKHYPNSFRETELLDELKNRGISELVICGMMTNMCVDATTRAAADLGFTCTVVADACAAATLEYNGRKVIGEDVHAAFIAALSLSYAEILSTQDYLKK